MFRLLLVAVLALMMGCNGLPGSFKRAMQGADADRPVAEAPVAEPLETDTTDPDAADDTASLDAERLEDPAVTAATPEAEVKPVVKPDPNAVARAKCAAAGDIFSKTKTGAFVCVSRTTDSGKTCSASSQCQGACLARSGTCSPMTPLVGCHDIVTESGGMATVCID